MICIDQVTPALMRIGVFSATSHVVHDQRQDDLAQGIIDTQAQRWHSVGYKLMQTSETS